ncbi:hypothetical protein FSBG_00116 [Fusobacterium gonidiaformans 3-1-5R]|uniref:Uncharacterized protein n=2 Tax=Fusobacterium TaxID=848 RepID=E5BET8_9FUSO|nr:hypothetical protein FSBG_00116 [Fusobacterium gonidiaformans 3-1-5R]
MGKMKLFKNVGIEDLESILKNGILPISETGNDNWEEGKRGNNAKDVVYLFSPKLEVNSFPKAYGIVLLEVEVEAQLNTFEKNDEHIDDYDEYIVDRVEVQDIKAVYIPKIFEDRVREFLTEETLKKVTFVEISAKHYQDFNLIEADEKTLSAFGKTAEIDSTEFNFFRGKRKVQGLFSEIEQIFDLYKVVYKF